MIKKDLIPGVHRILIVGGGAGGVELASRLGDSLGRKGKAEIMLVDVARTHIWKPLLHQIAAGTMDNHANEVEFLALSQANNFVFMLGRMDGLDREKKLISIAPVTDADGELLVPRQEIAYDTLVFALGSQTNDFNTPGARAHAIMLDSTSAALQFNEKMLNRCLRAHARREMGEEGGFTVTIIGGGATGVELAAELHMTASILTGYGFGNINPEKDLKIVIVDAAPRLLPVLTEKVSSAVARELTKLKVEIHTDEKVVEVSADGVRMASGTFIPSGLVVWAAGIKAPDFLANIAGLESNRINQLVVKKTLQTTRDENIFAMGDCAACPQGEGQPNVPPRAQSAHQMAMLLTKSLQRRLKGKSLPEFAYHDHGSLVSLGEYSTVGALGAIGGIGGKGGLFIEGQFAKWMYWSLYKKHQVAINGWFRTWLFTWIEAIHRMAHPRIKLH